MALIQNSTLFQIFIGHKININYQHVEYNIFWCLFFLASTTQKLNVVVENEAYKLIVKLPSSTEPCVFVLKPLETVRDLINDIREEDSKANTIVFHYLDGLRYVV